MLVVTMASARFLSFASLLALVQLAVAQQPPYAQCAFTLAILWK
jgi:hypothetical protein